MISTPPSITTLGIPSRNRPRILERAVSSYAHHALSHGRKVDIIVADDSRDPAVCAENREALQSINKGEKVNVFYADRTRRAAYARELAEAADVPIEIAEFALLGDDRCAFTYGASRNSLLLASAGKLILQVDDDTICQIARNPEYRDGLMVAHDEVENGMWFAPDFDALEYVDEDVLALHESLLGKKPVNCMAAYTSPEYRMNTSYLDEKLRKHINNEEAVIKATFLGAMGDSGMRNNIPMLLSEGTTHLRLVSDPAQYKTRLNSREIMYSSPQTCISRAGSCQTINIGLDNRDELHPFIPVGVNEDAIFSVILYACFPASFVGYLPYQLMHAPPGKRSYFEDAGMQPPCMNHLLEMLIHTLREYLTSPSASENLYSLGSLLKALTKVNTDEFESYVHRTFQLRMNRFIESLNKRVDEEPVAPSYWKDDVRQLADSVKRSLSDQTFFAPHDLPGSYKEKLATFQDLVSLYGRLLLHWPALFEAAKGLHDGGRRMAKPL